MAEYIDKQDLLLILNTDLLSYEGSVVFKDVLDSVIDCEAAKSKYEELARVINIIENQKSIKVKCPKDIDPIFVDKNCIINVVRCKDCKNWDKKTLICSELVSDKLPLPKGGRIAFKFDGNHFCSYGEKRSEQE